MSPVLRRCWLKSVLSPTTLALLSERPVLASLCRS